LTVGSLAPIGSDHSVFRSFLQGGFECSAHRRGDGVRLDLLASTQHERYASSDYQHLGSYGLRTVRDGVRWHLIERSPGDYDWRSFLDMFQAARAAHVEVIWDLCHYSCPDHLDIWSPQFIDRFAAFAGALARIVRDESDEVPLYCPINEISYWAWAGGEVGRINPGTVGQGPTLKRQLVRAAIAAIDAIRAVDDRARFVLAEPLIHVEPASTHPDHVEAAERYRLTQFEVHDLLSGRQEPELGGAEQYLDIIGCNFYPDNQWYLNGSTIPLGHHAYRPLPQMMREVFARYGRPLLIAETGAEGRAKSYWLHFVCGEVREAIQDGIPVLGVCLYPVLDYHGWENDRACDVGLLSHARADGHRLACPMLAEEVLLQNQLFNKLPPSGSTASGATRG
jgi:beta-glucosidase/6-phospho-beta-glucosidase/beta-galactosidase